MSNHDRPKEASCVLIIEVLQAQIYMQQEKDYNHKETSINKRVQVFNRKSGFRNMNNSTRYTKDHDVHGSYTM